MISIIIRTKNEERWITSCLKAVFNQEYKDFEVIIVDNNSTDKTVMKAKLFDVRVIYIDDYLPGKALNMGVRASKGDFIACLSAHCIPVNSSWLSNLLRNFDSDKIAGVYGRQEPMSFSSDFDKRDLLITFGLDRKVQIKDSFFHNANSLIRKDVWEKIPFVEAITNIEDRVWAKEVLKSGYNLIYEPEASVYHYHGIHQNRDQERCSNVVRIIESLEMGERKNYLDAKKLDIIALIPMKEEVKYIGGKPLIEYTVERALESMYINRVIVLTDNSAIAEISIKAGAEIPFIRDPKYSDDKTNLITVLHYSLNKIEKLKISPDILAILQPNFPFRPKGLIDDLIRRLLSQGLDSIMPGVPAYGSYWIKRDNNLERIDEGDIPKDLKKPIYMGLKGLGCITYPVYVREKRFFGDNVGILPIHDPYCSIEITDETSLELANKLIGDWWNKNKKERG